MTESKQSSAPKRAAEQLQVMEYRKGGTRNSQVCSGKYETEPSVPALTSWGGAGFTTCATRVPRTGTVMSGTSWMYCGARVESGYSKTWNVSSPTGLQMAVSPARRQSQQGSRTFQDQPGQGLPWAPRAAWGKTGVRTAPKSARHHSPKGNQTQVWRLREAGWCQRKEG